MLKRVLGGCLVLLLLLGAAVVLNTWRQGSRQVDVPARPGLTVDAQAVAQSLAVAIRARTVSSLEDPALNLDQFHALQDHLRSRYPRVHAQLQREVVGGLSLLYTWPGTDPSLRPLALMAHQDVVPIAPGTESKWSADPFGGEIRDGYVWGRGAWDDKANLIAELEAVEALLARGYRPRRTVLLIFGADEEVGGLRGARQVARLLQERGVRLEFVVDEGLLLTEGLMPGLQAPAALIGVAEKGYLSLRLTAEATPGHSSMPPAPGRSAVAQISQALARLDRQPLPGSIGGVAAELFDTLAPEMQGASRYLLSNRWLFGPLIERQLANTPSTNALMRTTTALTMVHAGNKDNVLPGRAEAVVNLRILPGESRAGATEAVRRIVADESLRIEGLDGSSEPSRISSSRTDAYRQVERSVRELFPGTLVAPGLMVAATDARHLEPLTDQVFRFSPVRAKPEDLARFHGTNERIAVANLAELVQFYHRLLEQSTGA